MGKIYQALAKSNTSNDDPPVQILPGNTADLTTVRHERPHSPLDPAHVNDTAQSSRHKTGPSQPTEAPSQQTKHTSRNTARNIYDNPDLVIPDNIAKNLVTVHTPYSVEAEQFRLLKNNILFPEKGVPPKTIMVTSPSPSEGKTFVAANLAATIAQSIDEYVLLIDCDLRSPDIHKIFGLTAPPGLSEYLSRAVPLSSLLVKTFLEKLTVLPSGAIPPNPSELLSSEQMRRLLNEVKTRYNDRYVIIDTPPPYLTSETNALARLVDGIILVVRQGKTRKKEIQNILDIYGRKKIIGVVQNFAPKKPGYGYGYDKYGYGS